MSKNTAKEPSSAGGAGATLVAALIDFLIQACLVAWDHLSFARWSQCDSHVTQNLRTSKSHFKFRIGWFLAILGKVQHMAGLQQRQQSVHLFQWRLHQDPVATTGAVVSWAFVRVTVQCHSQCLWNDWGRSATSIEAQAKDIKKKNLFRQAKSRENFAVFQVYKKFLDAYDIATHRETKCRYGSASLRGIWSRRWVRKHGTDTPGCPCWMYATWC